MSKVQIDSYRAAELWIVFLLVSGISRRKDTPPSLCCCFQDYSIRGGLLAYRILQWSPLGLWPSPQESDRSSVCKLVRRRAGWHTKIQDQPRSPPIPSIKLIPYASKPENAPFRGWVLCWIDTVTVDGVTWRCGCSKEDGKAALQHVLRIPHRKAQWCVSGEQAIISQKNAH